MLHRPGEFAIGRRAAVAVPCYTPVETAGLALLTIVATALWVVPLAAWMILALLARAGADLAGRAQGVR